MISIKRILAPTDFSPHSEGAIRYACEIAEKFSASLHLLHVLQEFVPVFPDLAVAAALPPEYFEQSEERAIESLQTILKPEWGTPAEVKRAIRWGNAVESICDYSTDQDVDLIVIATHGRTGLGRLLLGSVAERIVREAPCPVLTVRTPAKKAAADKPKE